MYLCIIDRAILSHCLVIAMGYIIPLPNSDYHHLPQEFI